MKQIKRSEIAKQVKVEYKEGRDWCRGGFGRCYELMINTDNAKIWCDVFLNENDYSVYHSSTIQQLDTVYGYVSDVENGYVDSAIELLTEVGWIITDFPGDRFGLRG